MNNVLTDKLLDVALTYMEGLDCARSLTVAILLRYGEYEQINTLSIDALSYLDADSYFLDACATSFLTKLRTNESASAEQATFEKWLHSEHQCFRTNLRLQPLLHDGFRLDEERMRDFVSLMRKRVRSLIGDYPPEAVFELRFGPGATVSDKASRTTVLDKLSSVPTLTPGAWRLLVPWSGTKWRAALGDELKEVRGNTYFTVPKNALIRRSCGKEPSLNVAYQLGLGRALRKLLKRQGINLDSGQELHRSKAREASITGAFATIDLSSASDCVSTALVELLIPPKWKKYLDVCRSPLTCVNGKWYHLEKYSSMGNGYTFELETLIFVAVCSAVYDYLGEDVSLGDNLLVYGDDIIVKTSMARPVLAALKYFGFTPNTKKTFVEGYFRESCGGDFFKGVPVRGFFLKESPDEPHLVFAASNGIYRASKEASGDPDPRFLRAWFKCLDLLPSHLRRLRGPEGLGDVVIHDENVSLWQTRWRNSIRFIRIYRPAKYRKVFFDWYSPNVQFAAALYNVVLQRPDRVPDDLTGYLRTLSDFGAFIVPRSGVTGYKVGWAPYS